MAHWYIDDARGATVTDPMIDSFPKPVYIYIYYGYDNNMIILWE